MRPCLVKTAILCLERFSNGTNVFYFELVSKYFCMEQSLALSSRMAFPHYNFHLPSGLLWWRTRIVFLVWDFVLPGSVHFCFSTAILSYNIMWCSFPPMADNDFLYSSSAYHRESIVGWRPCFPGRAFLSICFAWKYSFCRSEGPCLAPRLMFFLNNIARDWGDVTVVLVELCWSLRRLHISSTTAIDYTDFPVGIALRTLLFGRSFAKFEDLGVVQVGDQNLRFFAELFDLLRLAQILNEWLCLWFSNFSINFLTLFSRVVSCWKWYARNSVVNGVVPGFSVTLRIAWWVPRWYCVWAS